MPNKESDHDRQQSDKAIGAAAELTALAPKPGHPLTSAMAGIAAERAVSRCFLEDVEECEFVAPARNP